MTKKIETKISSLDSKNNKGLPFAHYFLPSRKKIYVQVWDLLGFRYDWICCEKGWFLCWKYKPIRNSQFKSTNRFHHYRCSLSILLVCLSSLYGVRGDGLCFFLLSKQKVCGATYAPLSEERFLWFAVNNSTSTWIYNQSRVCDS